MSIKQPKRSTRIAVGAALSAAAALGLSAVAAAPAGALTFTSNAVSREPVYVTYYGIGGYVFNEGAFCAAKGMGLSSYLRMPGFIGDYSITCVYWVNT